MDKKTFIVLFSVVAAGLALPAALIQPEDLEFVEDPGNEEEEKIKPDSLGIPPLEQQVIETIEHSEIPQPPREQSEPAKEGQTPEARPETPKEPAKNEQKLVEERPEPPKEPAKEEQKPVEERQEPPKQPAKEEAEISKENEATSPQAATALPEQPPRPSTDEKPIIIAEEDRRPSFLSNIFPWFSSFSLPHLSDISFPSWSSIKIPKLPFFSLPSSSSLSKSREYSEEEPGLKYVWIKYFVSE